MSNEVIDRIAAILKDKPFGADAGQKVSADAGRLFASDMTCGEKVELFKDRTGFSGSKVYDIKDVDSLKDTLSEILAGRKVRVSISGCERLDKRLGASVSGLLPDDCEYISTQELYQKSKLFELDFAITDVHLAVAETGSVIIESNEQLSRLTSLIAGEHIVILWPDQIVCDLLDFADNIKQQVASGAGKSYTVISGPSKTADIEMKLVIGVHGPKVLHVLIMS